MTSWRDKVAAHLAAAWNLRDGWNSIWPSKRKGTSRLAPLDGARAIAVLWVLWFHVFVGPMLEPVKELEAVQHPHDSMAGRWMSSWATQPLLNGGQGVDIFFTISGFLIAYMWLGEVSETGGFRCLRFYVRRFLRIWPTLAVALGCVAIGSRLAASSNAAAKISADACAADWWKVLLFLNDILPTPCLGMSWSVAVEYQFYLVSPLLMWTAYCPRRNEPRRFGRAFLAAASLLPVLLLGVTMAVLGYPGGNSAFDMPEILWKLPTYTTPLMRCGPYFAGMFAAVAVDQARRREQIPTTAAAAAAAAACSSKVGAGKCCSSAGSSSSSLDKDSAAGGGCSSASLSQVAEQQQGRPQGASSSQGFTVIDLTPGGFAPARRPAAGSTSASATTASQQAEQDPLLEPPLWRRYRGQLLLAADLLAVAVVLLLTYVGVGVNKWMAVQAPGLNQVLQLVGRWAYGWALAWIFTAVLLGRLRHVSRLLCWHFFVPIAAISYSTYLLQKGPMAIIPSWNAAGVVSMWAAWGTGLLGCLLATLLSMLVALPCYLLVERPFSLLWPRAW